jgi:hypothetical protein
MKDLICVVADKNMEAALESILKRHDALGIREITFDIVVHPRRDPGVFREGVELLFSFKAKYQRGLLLLDASWDGAPKDISSQLDRALADAGLCDWARVVLIDPELEVWVWSDSPHVEEALGWSGREPSLRQWLVQRGFLTENSPKPKDPKAAVEAALCEARKPRSSAIYRTLASNVSLRRCRDSSFQCLRQTLQEWFGSMSYEITAD